MNILRFAHNKIFALVLKLHKFSFEIQVACGDVLYSSLFEQSPLNPNPNPNVNAKIRKYLKDRKDSKYIMTDDVLSLYNRSLNKQKMEIKKQELSKANEKKFRNILL